jgi:hypothetical protein
MTQAFHSNDCEVFGRYPNSASWNEVSKGDQELFKSVWAKLKELSERLSANAKAPPPLKAETSHYVPNGKSPKEIWCCVHPVSVPNKSYGLQVALIISARGAEFCFCVGSGTSQIGDPAKKRELEKCLDVARVKLRSLPTEVVTSVGASQKRKWFYRKLWLAEPNKADFNSLADWLNYAGTTEGSGASVSAYFSPAQLSERVAGPSACSVCSTSTTTRSLRTAASRCRRQSGNRARIHHSGRGRNRGRGSYSSYLNS